MKKMEKRRKEGKKARLKKNIKGKKPRKEGNKEGSKRRKKDCRGRNRDNRRARK